MSEFQFRFGFAPGATREEELRDLIEQPVVFRMEAVPAPSGSDAATLITTETHAVYPVEPGAMVAVLKDESHLTDIMPDLVVHETICRHSATMIKQRQRTEFRVLFFRFGTEYLIDIHYALESENEYGSYWGMYESLDGRLSHQFGSWYFHAVEIDGQPYPYVRHFITTGVTSRVPGLRMVTERSAPGRVIAMFDAVYRETVRRYGTTG
jgi:hypothetical protein